MTKRLLALLTLLVCLSVPALAGEIPSTPAPPPPGPGAAVEMFTELLLDLIILS